MRTVSDIKLIRTDTTLWS